jgi:hypothetical protein
MTLESEKGREGERNTRREKEKENK